MRSATILKIMPAASLAPRVSSPSPPDQQLYPSTLDAVSRHTKQQHKTLTIPMPKRTGIIPPEIPMVIIMPIRTAPERHNPPQTPREIVPRVRVDGLELPQRHPRQHRHQMHVAVH